MLHKTPGHGPADSKDSGAAVTLQKGVCLSPCMSWLLLVPCEYCETVKELCCALGPAAPAPASKNWIPVYHMTYLILQKKGFIPMCLKIGISLLKLWKSCRKPWIVTKQETGLLLLGEEKCMVIVTEQGIQLLWQVKILVSTGKVSITLWMQIKLEQLKYIIVYRVCLKYFGFVGNG